MYVRCANRDVQGCQGVECVGGTHQQAGAGPRRGPQAQRGQVRARIRAHREPLLLQQGLLSKVAIGMSSILPSISIWFYLWHVLIYLYN